MSARKLGINLIVIVAVAALFTGAWAWFNQPVSAPDWPEQVSGFSFSPFRLDESPQQHRYPSEQEILADLALVSEHTDNIRTYTLEGSLALIPQLARAHGLRVTLGIWIGQDLDANEEQIRKGIELAKSQRNVVRVIVGNEALFRGDISIEQLTAYLDRVRAAVRVPVTTAEQWHVWDKHPELAQHVDLIGAHVLPYWENMARDQAVDFVL